MKKLFTLGLLFAIFDAFAQNLVQNPSFEGTVQCPNFVSQIDFSDQASGIYLFYIPSSEFVLSKKVSIVR